MTTRTESLEAYKKAIRAHYEIEKQGKYSSFLINPSRAKLRQLCEERLKESNEKEDKLSFNLVFGFEYDAGNRNKLKSLTDKFRPIETFLKGETDLSDIEAINITALLVNFKPRPFRVFNTNSFGVQPENEELSTNKEETNEPSIKIQKPEPRKNFKKKIAIGVLGLIGLTSIGYTAKTIIAPEPQCMQWQKKHYEVVDCNGENQLGLLKQHDIIPFDEHQSKLIKIEVSDTTTFFKNGKSLYWYCKVDGEPEFFNTHGVHPETGKALKPVSKYIIEKYVE
ncbi:hypothetical protein [Flavobacterium sp.]|uniref:hypothetical protein n=1 Tax=Flavobacterium sp. TaxID=239 RepID=UPI0008AE04B7|nr:hypothetical protein [Flavobacterium sp.]OGS61249.1 MAG: hypothetical protein A2X07_06335 [Flavobacteria bacterium GWF1_32_7]HBD25665.1 hypothetical protein [Flavobacterium sp.]